MLQENKQKGNKDEGVEVTKVEIIKDRIVVRCNSELDQEKTRRKERLRNVYMLNFFSHLRLLVSSSPVENRISRISSWPYWNVYFLTVTGMTRQGRRVEKCHEGWRPGDRRVRCSALDVFLVVGAVEPAALEAVIVPGPVGDGGGGSQPCVAHHSKPLHSPNPRNRRRTRSLREVQRTAPLRPRHPRVHMTC